MLCTTTGSEAACTGDQSAGIASGVDFLSPPVASLSVLSLEGEIATTGKAGISFLNVAGGGVAVHSGEAGEPVVIGTAGHEAPGILAQSQGTSPGVITRPALGLKLPAGFGGAGGPVQVDGNTNISTSGNGSHGIVARNKVGGYHPDVIASLESFDPDSVTLAVASVNGLPANVGNPVAGDQGGTFTLRADGTYDFAPGSAFDSLEAGEQVTTRVTYRVSQVSASGSDFADGRIAMVVSRNEGGGLDFLPAVYFPEYDLSGDPDEPGAHPLWPDLQRYVDGLLADAGVAGSGESIHVVNAGTIATTGAGAHGVLAETESGGGTTGSSGTFWDAGKIPTPGGNGANGGSITVTNDGAITTTSDDSMGIVALSRGGKGGRGGDGGPWRWGARGGTGGTGGDLTVDGGGTIHTGGERASGILAVSEGGPGGTGGEGEASTSGGNGGFGGNGGNVTVEAGSEITTDGADSHAIWAKSVGGAGGTGGTGGWLGGSGGGGGEASDGGSVTIRSGGELETFGSDSHGLYAESVGGFGGSGGSAHGLIVSWGGGGNRGGSGGQVTIETESGGSITTHADRSHAILAQSVGGGGGSGGSAGAIVGLGGAGSAGGHGGSVSVENASRIDTFGAGARGIYAQSVGGGGGDGGASGGIVAIGGSGSGTSDGGDVTVENLVGGAITTQGEESHAIFAESIGGGGGDGGRSGGWFSFGGSAGGGGDGGAVDVTNSERLETLSTGAVGIFAQSVGGGGGNGGSSVSAGPGVSVSVGGRGGAGGIGGRVGVTSVGDAEIVTGGSDAYGIFAQSVGGGGGNGGYAVSYAGGVGPLALAIGIGGRGGEGGAGGEVAVGGQCSITTSGEAAHAILAQSVGGGGGKGGFSVAAATGGQINLSIGVGGSGGDGGSGNAVTVGAPGGDGADPEPLQGDITTTGERAYGILAQSTGGGGGDGGFSVSAALGGPAAIGLAFGGKGGVGGAGGSVDVLTESDITTDGSQSYGILAQSVGGGGGSGGFSVAGAGLGSAAIALGFGGSGGAGSAGSAVAVDSLGDITTRGVEGHGIVAQSVGGGGGAGGFSLAAGVSAFGGLALSMGGDGGLGNSGGPVDVDNRGSIETFEEFSHGVLAQSIGGGGGTGGSSTSVMASFIGALPLPPEIPEISADVAIALGGKGGKGGEGGQVDVTNEGVITTHADYAYGVYAQSLGGGGGAGGKGVAATADISLPDEEPTPSIAVHFALAIGGAGGDGNKGGAVDVTNTGLIDTSGEGSHAIFSQSVGGGGGSGGDARALTVSIDPLDWIPGSSPSLPAINISVGGSGGTGGDAGAVTIENEDEIVTRGADAYGIFGQSIGGGGGTGGTGYHGLPEIPSWLDPILEFTPLKAYGDLQIVVGGTGGSSGDGGEVSIASAGSITTLEDGSIGAFAQSVGGGGGIGGDGALGLVGKVAVGGGGGAAGDGGEVEVEIEGDVDTSGTAAHGIFAQSVGGGGGRAGNVDRGIGNFGIGLGIGQDGGSSGDGGEVRVDSAGNITTRGAGATGIFAQSVGGGGGVAGGVGYGIGFAGSAGGDGSGGRIEVTHDGDVTTLGDVSHGIVAQSAGGQLDLVKQRVMALNADGSIKRDGAGNVVWLPETSLPDRQDRGSDIEIEIRGDVRVYGEDSHGIVAQSVGGDGNGDLSLDIVSGSVQGGAGSGAGVYFADGDDNSLINAGTISALSGRAIVASGGDETVRNFGTVVGDVELGGGTNLFQNRVGAEFLPGATIDLGGGRLENDGRLSLAAASAPQTTALTGDFFQSDTGSFVTRVARDGSHDRLEISGGAALGGELVLARTRPAFLDGTTFEILEAGDGIDPDSAFARRLPEPRPLLTFELVQTANSLSAVSDVSPYRSVADNQVEAAVARYMDALLPDADGDLADILGDFQALPEEEFDTAFASVSTHAYDDLAVASLSLARAGTRVVSGRMAHRRAPSAPYYDYPPKAEPAAGEPPPVASPPGIRTSDRGLWLGLFGEAGERDSHDGFSGFDATSSGVTLGFDTMIEERWLFGASVSKARADFDADRGRGSGDIDSVQLSAYASWFGRNGYLDGVLSYARNDTDAVRRIWIDPTTRTTTADYDANLWSALAETGLRIPLPRAVLEPFVSLEYARLSEERFREKGFGSLASTIEGRDTDSLQSELGVRLYGRMPLRLGVLMPELTVAWSHDFEIDDRTLTTSWAGANGLRYGLDGSELGRDGLRLAANLRLLARGGWSASLGLRTEQRHYYETRTASLQLDYSF